MANTLNIQSFPPGNAAPTSINDESGDIVNVGDFILTHSTNRAGQIIRFGQAIRFRGKNRKYAFWNHCAIITSPTGDIVEALTKTGLTRNNLSKYKGTEYTLVRVDTNKADQEQILRFVDKTVGEKYGWASILSCFLGVLTGSNFVFGVQTQTICSGHVARSQERSGAYFDKCPQNILPADLARYYGVEIPSGFK